MNRKRFLKNSIATGSILITQQILGETKVMLSSDQFQERISGAKNLTQIYTVLDELKLSYDKIHVVGAWGIGKILSHCAQSIQYSMDGYPEMKSAFFRGTAGSLAFTFFSLRGKMSHGLEEPIPGATELNPNANYSEGSLELQKAIERFSLAKAEELKPHFAYGTLDKEEYENAHLFHIKNHLERVSLVS